MDFDIGTEEYQGVPLPQCVIIEENEVEILLDTLTLQKKIFIIITRFI